MRHDDRDGSGTIDVELRSSQRRIDHWFLDEEDAVVARAPGQKMLRSLKDKVPTQVRQTHDIGEWWFRCRQHGGSKSKKYAGLADLCRPNLGGRNEYDAVSVRLITIGIADGESDSTALALARQDDDRPAKAATRHSRAVDVGMSLRDRDERIDFRRRGFVI